MFLGRFKAALFDACVIVYGLFVPGVSPAAPAGWVVQHSNSPPGSFRGVHAVSSQVVWVSGTRGACLRTVDGGETWENHDVPGAEQLDFRGVFAFNADSAVLISSGDAEKGQTRIYRTADGGRTWQTVFQTQTKGAFLDGVSFWDKTNGLALGDQLDGKWLVLKSADGGRTWERVAPAGLPKMQTNEGAFAAGNTSIAMQDSSQVWLAWRQRPRPHFYFDGPGADVARREHADVRRTDRGHLQPAVLGFTTCDRGRRRLQTTTRCLGQCDFIRRWRPDLAQGCIHGPARLEGDGGDPPG